MSLFTFDEESFSNEFDSLEIKEHVDPLQENLNVGDAQALNSNQLKVSDGKLLSRSAGRRRSSVYRRFSVKSLSTTPSKQDFQIPSNYSNTFDTESAIEVSDQEEDTPLGKKKLEDFKPIKVLGQGAYGKVHLVQDSKTNRLYAQKQLRKPVINIKGYDNESHSDKVKRTISERQILSNITHHFNIVKLFYALQDRDKFYLILEYLPGGELFHHLASSENKLGNVFKEEDVAFYAAEMALGLRHLHKLNIVYRDLKPENCLLNARGHLVLTDFGLSKEIGHNENGDNCTSIIGTPEYMAPEILKGEEYDFPVDWWSLGCVIFDMMSGNPPFTGGSHKAIQDKILKNKLKLPFYFSMDAKDLLHKLLNKNPQKRFQVDDNWDRFTSHRFFRKINWSSLELQDKDSQPPIVPVITDPILAENFDPQFTSMKLSDYSHSENSINIPFHESQEYFQGFSYTASNSLIEKFIQS